MKFITLKKQSSPLLINYSIHIASTGIVKLITIRLFKMVVCFLTVTSHKTLVDLKALTSWLIRPKKLLLPRELVFKHKQKSMS